MQPPSNAFLASMDDVKDEKRYPLRAKVCELCKLVQVDYDVAPEELFSNYVYFSSYADEWLAHAKAYCEMALRRFALDSSSLVVELASNDGYLLKNFVQSGIPVLGIDPSDTVAAAAQKIGVPTLVEFFGERLARELKSGGRQADLIIANNVLAHVPQLNDFVAGIAVLLKARRHGDDRISASPQVDRAGRVRHDLSRALFIYFPVRHRAGVRPAWIADSRCRAIADAWWLAAHLRLACQPRRPSRQRVVAVAAGAGSRGRLGRSRHVPALRRTRRDLSALRARIFCAGQARGQGRWQPTAPPPKAIPCSIFAA